MIRHTLRILAEIASLGEQAPNGGPRPDLARAWREARHMTRGELSALIGYSAGAIQQFETGRRSKGVTKPIGEPEWKRYRMACAAIDRNAQDFNWGAT